MEPIKVFGVWTVGLAVMLGTTGVSLALPKMKPGHTYCVCTCAGEGIDPANAVLSWEKVASCSVNGKACKSGGKKGVLSECNQCTGQADGKPGGCNPAKPRPPFQPPELPPPRPSPRGVPQ
jgi:hypothetical protein